MFRGVEYLTTVLHTHIRFALTNVHIREEGESAIEDFTICRDNNLHACYMAKFAIGYQELS